MLIFSPLGLGSPPSHHRVRWRRVMLSVTGLVLLYNSLATTQWTNNPYKNTTVSLSNVERYVDDLLSDGKGGAFIAWGSYSPKWWIFIQRISPDGNLLWDTNGVWVSLSDPAQVVPTICSDGADGVIVAWTDARGDGADIYIQRISPTGTRLWGDTGVPICVAFQAQGYKSITSDGMGGAIVTWRDLRNDLDGDIYAQRINGNGVVQWAMNGVPVCAYPGSQGNPKVISDGQGGAYIVWPDTRPGSTYLQHIDGNGNALWAVNGIRACLGSTCGGGLPSIVTDGGTGCIVLWNGGPRAQRFSFNGTRLWGSAGVQVMNYNEGYRSDMVPDGRGGLIFCTGPYVPGTGRTDIYVQRVASDGSLPWGLSGVAICTTHTADLYHPRLSSDGDGGAIIVWGDYKGGDSIDVYAQRVDSSGNVRFAVNGTPVSLGPRSQQWPIIVPDLKGGGIVSWSLDDRNEDITPLNPYFYDIFVQNIDHHGYLGVTQPRISSIGDVPADQGGFLALNWRGTYLDRDSVRVVYRYAIFRQDTLGGSWVWAGGVTATSDTSYTLVVPTANDSTASGLPVARFMVQALSLDSQMVWKSDSDSGYSVDNLHPAVVASLQATLEPDSSIRLWWPLNLIDPDVRGYAIYRAESSNVVTPFNKISLTTDSVYIDSLYRPGTKATYYVIVEDLHDNQSPPSPDASVETLRNFPYLISQAGWHLLSVPVSMNDYRKTSLFPTTGSTDAYAYDGGYRRIDTLLPGLGFWLRFATSETSFVTGFLRSTDTIPVKYGWNMVGSVSEPVRVSSITSLPGGAVTSQFYTYDNTSAAYETVDSLFPGVGYWVKVSQDASLTMGSLGGEQDTRQREAIVIRPIAEKPPPPPAGSMTGVGGSGTKPSRYALHQNTPNPFNPQTAIEYEIPEPGFVTLRVFDVLGKVVATLVNEFQPAGAKTVIFDAQRFPSGLYFYRLQVGWFADTKRMMLMK